MTPVLTPGGHPEGTDPGTVHPIAPYERDPRRWTRGVTWYDTASGTPCRITTHNTTSPHRARVKSIAELLADYVAHPEVKAADADGNPAGPRTRGILQRRHVQVVDVVYIGKETNRLEEVAQGQVRSWDEVQERYQHPKRTFWDTVCRSTLQLS